MVGPDEPNRNFPSPPGFLPDAFLLLLIGGMNLVNLLLVRAGTGERELAIRQAIGATRHDVIRSATIETTLLALAGGLLGLAAGGRRRSSDVDVINQTDLVENPDGEDKLGQPMVNLAWITRAGTVDLFALIGFRARTFPGHPRASASSHHRGFGSGGVRRGRPPAAPRIGRALVANDRHMDIGVSHAYALARAPRLEPSTDDTSTTVLVPHYDRIHQTGLDAQWTAGGWLLKFAAEARLFARVPAEDPLYGLRRDDYLSLRSTRWF